MNKETDHKAENRQAANNHNLQPATLNEANNKGKEDYGDDVIIEMSMAIIVVGQDSTQVSEQEFQ